MQPYTLGNIAYEITNYLGNVNAVISDRKTWVSTVSAFKAVVLSKTDYFPFGQEISSRTVVMDGYRYGYTGKEKDNEINASSYDFGNRQYDPRIGRWLSLDPLKAMYPSMSPYCYAGNTPIAAKDPDGNRIIIVNGYYNANYPKVGKTEGRKPYWGDEFEENAQTFFGDYSGGTQWVDGNVLGFTGIYLGGELAQKGYEYAKEHFYDLTKGMDKDEVINLVGHSMGAAFAAGMAKYFEEEGTYKVDQMVMLSAYDATGYSVPKSAQTYQLGYNGDPVVNVWREIKNIDFKGIVNRTDLGIQHKHGTTTNAGVFSELMDLKYAKLTKTNKSKETYLPDKASNEIDGKMYHKQSLYNISNMFYKTDFNYIKTLDVKRYHRESKGTFYRPSEQGEIIIRKDKFLSENEDAP